MHAVLGALSGSRRGRLLQLTVLGLASFLMAVPMGCSSFPGSAAKLSRLNATAIAAHEKRRLAEASQAYAALLRAQPPAEPSPAQFQLIQDLAPRLLVTPTEPFRLVDVVVILHPHQPWIAYHLFWEDDIDFPEDNDPTDHEVIWVEYDPASLAPRSLVTYFHGTLLRHPLTDRPVVGIEWGKHGSVPMQDGRLAVDPPALDRHWERLATTGSRLPDHPLARNWPRRFNGDREAYREFRTEIDPREFLVRKRLAWVSPWANAVLDQYALPYNFAAKTEWPE